MPESSSDAALSDRVKNRQCKDDETMEAHKKAAIILTVLTLTTLLLVAFEWLSDQSVPELKEHVVHYIDRQITS
ncbi:hypothetical protein ASE99_13960 [Serratia sp. Leaf51]|nr:hypothetical protein ASE99_13960 [Serratia sp. Leaf51]